MFLILALIMAAAGVCRASEAEALRSVDFEQTGRFIGEALAESGVPLPFVPQPEPAAPPDELRPAVLAHLDRLIRRCGRDRSGCEAGGLRDFAEGLGSALCVSGSYNCVQEVLETCREKAAAGKVSPARYMTCAAMLGRLGERDCAAGNASCAGDLQGALYFSVRASAACLKSFEKDPRRERAERMAERFAGQVHVDVRGVYVGKVKKAAAIRKQLAWAAAGKAVDQVKDELVDSLLERYGLGGLFAPVRPVFVIFSGVKLAGEVAASEMNNMVCLNWAPRYDGSYANAAGSVRRMASFIEGTADGKEEKRGQALFLE